MRGGRRKLVVRVWAGLALAGALAVVLAFAARPSSARSAAGCTPSWQVVPDALPQTTWIATDSPTDAWAENYGHKIEHWDGQKWSLSWDPRAGDPGFGAMAVASPSAAWVIGFTGAGPEGAHPPLIGSWDGTRWHVDHIPTLPGRPWLSDVVAVSPTDAWAVGGRWVKGTVPHGIRSLIWHWNGRSWKVVPSAKIGHPTRFVPTPKTSWLLLAGERKIPASGDQLDAIAAVSANNIWAVGQYDVLFSHHKRWGYVNRLLTEHWNGKKWTVASTRPALSGYANDTPQAEEDILSALAAAPSGAVLGLSGGYFSDASFTHRVWWLHGSIWGPDKSLPRSYQPTAVTMTSQQDAWVFGDTSTQESGVGSNPVPAAHWDGSQWLPTQLPARGTVNAAAASAPNNVWVAGTLKPTTGKSSQNEMLHYTC